MSGAAPSFSVPLGEARVERSAAAFTAEEWGEAFRGEAKDGRYHGVVERTIGGPFEYCYLGVRDRAGRLRVLQPGVLTAQGLLAGLPAGARRAAATVRRKLPRFFLQKMLMVGCTAGEGHAGLIGDPAESAGALFDALDLFGRGCGAGMVTLKDFPKPERAVLDVPAAARGYFPGTVIVGLERFRDFDDYLDRALSKATRKDLRRKFRRADAAEPKLHLEVVADAAAQAGELHALYRQVWEKSEFRFEELTEEYFRALGREMPDVARFFVWRLGGPAGRAVAMSSVLVRDGRLHDNYLGLDYALAHERHLYHVTLRDVFNWAVRNGVREYYSTPLNYDPKQRLRFALAPLDLYVKSLNRIANPFLRRALPWLEPTRWDKDLRRFENWGEMR